MQISLRGNVWRELVELLPEGLAKAQKSQHRWGIGDDDRVKMEIEDFDDGALNLAWQFLDSKSPDRVCVLARNQIKSWMAIKHDPTSVTVPKLQGLVSVLTVYMQASAPHRYLFKQNPDGNFVPFFVSDITFHESSRNGGEAHVSVRLMTAKALSEDSGRRNRSSGESIHFLREDIRGRNVAQILQDKGYYIETPEMYDAYVEEAEMFFKYRCQDGLQLNVTGKARCNKGWYDRAFRPVERNGMPARMVVDAYGGEAERTTYECDFWSTLMGEKVDKIVAAERENPVWQIPVMTYLDVFDLETHEFYEAHVNNVEPYVYDVNVGSKLVLSEEVKDLLEILIEQASSEFSDIITGKAGGAIILCQGVPGTGKTLTAEVYAEVMQRPLYKVQSSQLGINVKDLEENLKLVLQRAEKWGAILLLDEADVYVRARGIDIEQNAIVGVFLRVLEYYRGVLFMTTNRGTEIDDAIISRMTARITYQFPDCAERREIWEILAAQNKLDFPETEIEAILVEELSGRDIKTMLKLSKMVADRRGVPVTAELIRSLLKFKQ